NDLDRLAGGHRGEALDLEHREEGFVHALGTHGLGRDHRHLALDALVDDEVLAGDLADRGDQRVDVGVLEVERRAGLRGNDGGHGEQAEQQSFHSVNYSSVRLFYFRLTVMFWDWPPRSTTRFT